MPFLSSSPQPPSHLAQRVQVHQHVQPQRKPSVFAEYNRHAQSCNRCKKPLEVYHRGELLCDVGHGLAIEVATVIYQLAGETASHYEPSSDRWVKLNVDLTHYDGPVYELAQAIKLGLNKRSPPKEAPVRYVRPIPISRHARDASPQSYYSSSSSSRRSDETPRQSGNISINMPFEHGREASYYEEFQRELLHSNGSKITPNYYYTDSSSPRPQLQRSNTYREPSSSRPARKSVVQFDPKVKYYP